jgi:hypothetical protein
MYCAPEIVRMVARSYWSSTITSPSLIETQVPERSCA